MTKTWFTARASGHTAQIEIFDEIGADGVSAEAFSANLKSWGSVNAIDLHVNSPGGDVFVATAIAAMLTRHPARVTAYVDGLAASAASLIVMAADVIVMPSNAMMMVHSPRGSVHGSTKVGRSMADALEKVETGMVDAYAKRSGQSVETVRQMLADETWMTAAQAVALGFADRVEQPTRIAATFDLSKYAKRPAAGTFETFATAYWDQQRADGLSPERVSAIPETVATELDVPGIYARYNATKAEGIE